MFLPENIIIMNLINIKSFFCYNMHVRTDT